MASIINAATSGGLVTTADTSGILQLQTAGTTAVTVDASQNVGIGQSSPTVKLDILNTNATYSLSQKMFNASAGTFFIGQAPAATFLSVDNFAMVFCTNSNGGVAGTSVPTNERARFPAAGGFQAKTTISVGDATPASTGAGITFPATQSASTDANTLDDYEEGTWTPSLGGTATYSFQGGLYTKIGRSVTTQGWLIVSSIGTGSTNDVSGLPFTCVSQQVGTGGSVGYFENLNNNIVFITPEVQPNTTSFVFNTLAAAGATASYNTSLWKNTTRLSFVNTYFV